jgi:hypothetical protein
MSPITRISNLNPSYSHFRCLDFNCLVYRNIPMLFVMSTVRIILVHPVDCCQCARAMGRTRFQCLEISFATASNFDINVDNFN